MSEQGPNSTSGKTGDGASRLFPLDALRGLLIVLMALDHASHFVAQKHSAGEYWGGFFPVYSDSLAFLTRWVTHLAAPGFFFLMGAGMLLFAHSRRGRGWGRWAIIRHFWIRGVVLIGLQRLVVNRAWELSVQGWRLDPYLGVLVGLGGGMILASLLLWLRPGYLWALALVLLVGMELLTPDPSQWGQEFSLPVSVLLVPGGQSGWWVSYPVLQWLELIVLGLAFGHGLVGDPRSAYRRAFSLGIGFLLAFGVIRFLDGPGNLRPWAGDTWIDFLNPVKYPPSIAFTSMSMGLNLLLLGFFSRAGEGVRRILRPLAVFGRVPLFFYVLHLFLYAGMGHVLTPEGTSLPVMYLYWLLGLVILYPVCLGVGRFKQRQPAHSIWRFF